MVKSEIQKEEGARAENRAVRSVHNLYQEEKTMKTFKCAYCEDKGYVYVPDGPEDVQSEDCPYHPEEESNLTSSIQTLKVMCEDLIKNSQETVQNVRNMSKISEWKVQDSPKKPLDGLFTGWYTKLPWGR